MKYRVVIRAFTLRRDLGWAILVQKALELKGAEVIIACSRNFSWIIQVWKPHVVVFNTIGQIENSRKNAPRSMLVHWPGEGGEPWEHCDARLISQRPDLFDDLSLVLAWGRDSLNQYKRAFPSKVLEKVVVCGNPRMDLIKYGLRPTSRANSIGFATRFNSICHFDGRPTLYTLTNSGNLDSVIGQAKSLVTVIRLIKLVLAETNYQVSIRPHPLEAPEYYDRYVKSINPERISIDEGFDFSLWMSRQGVIVTPTSSSFVESYILKKPVINIDGLAGNQDLGRTINEYSKYTGDALAYAPTSDEEFLEMIKDVLNSRKPKAQADAAMDKHLSHTQDWPRDYSSIDRGANQIIQKARENISVPRLWPLDQLIRIKDNFDFSQIMKRDKLHANKNYHPGYHETDSVYEEIMSRMVAEKP